MTLSLGTVAAAKRPPDDIRNAIEDILNIGPATECSNDFAKAGYE